MNRVIIIGGGITGLSAAWALRQAPSPPEVLLLEKSERLGGCIYTEYYKGFLMEHGPDVFLARKPEAVQLCEALGLRLQKTNEQYRGVYLRQGQRLYPVPEGMSGLVPSRIWPLLSSPLLSLRGRLRVLMELVIPRRTDGADESVAQFFTRRFGQEAFSTLIEPLLGGLAGGEADQLSIKALMPHVLNLESNYGSILLGIDRKPAQEPGSSLRSLQKGLSSLIDALVHLNQDIIQTGHDALTLRRVDAHWEVALSERPSLLATDIILAVPAWNAATMMDSVSTELTTLLRSIQYKAGSTVQLAYLQGDVPRPLNGHGHLVASHGSSSVVACTWSALKLTGRAPKGHLLFRIYLRGCEHTDEELLLEAKAEIFTALGITADPLFTRIHRFPATLPQYTLGHQDRIKQLRYLSSSFPGLFLAGNYLDGVGIPDCIRSGLHAADQVLQRQQSRSVT